jgi:hypothetical protein
VRTDDATEHLVTGRGRSRWIVRIGMVVVGVAGLTGFAAVEDTSPRVLPTVLYVGAVVAIYGMLVDTGGAQPANWSPAAESAVGGGGQDTGLAGNMRLLENHLSARDVDPYLQSRLARMTDDRLSRMGLSRGEPEVARLLGPTLSNVLTGEPRRLKVAEIDECIRRIEELSP